jgi:hypothetical protein
MIYSKRSSFFSWKMLSNHPGFTIGHRWHFSFPLVAIILSILCIVLNTGQTIGLTLFLGSFHGLTGVYFVVFFGAFSYGFISGLIACWFGYKGQITSAMREWRWTKYMIFISIFDAANAFLITSTYSNTQSNNNSIYISIFKMSFEKKISLVTFLQCLSCNYRCYI